MAEKLLIVLANSDPANASELTAPLVQALVAASMDYEVEVVLTGGAGELARRGFAARLPAPQNNGRTIYDYMQEARQAGVQFKVCSPASALWSDELIPEIDETVGDAYVISEAMAEGTVTFTY